MTVSRGERGQVGGLEGLLFGMLVFVFGTLLVVNGWSVVDAKAAASAAAREATRAYVESTSPADADVLATEAGMQAFEGYGRARIRAVVARVEGSLSRCERVVFEAAYVVPLLQVPLLGSAGRGMRVSARHSEVVDPYRSGPAGAAACG